MIEVPPDLEFKSDKEEYEYYYYYPLPMAIVVMVILDNYKNMKRQIFEKIKNVATPYIIEFQRQSVPHSAEKAERSLMSEEPNCDLDQAAAGEPEETMLRLSEVMNIMQSVVFFDESTYADIKGFF